jgi:hypothetical protein
MKHLVKTALKDTAVAVGAFAQSLGELKSSSWIRLQPGCERTVDTTWECTSDRFDQNYRRNEERQREGHSRLHFALESADGAMENGRNERGIE